MLDESRVATASSTARRSFASVIPKRFNCALLRPENCFSDSKQGLRGAGLPCLAATLTACVYLQVTAKTIHEITPLLITRGQLLSHVSARR